MNRTYNKNIFRTIKNSLARYFAIMAIIALGVGFFSGLKVTKPGMIQTGDSYMKEHNMYDFRLLSAFGFSNDMIDMISKYVVDGAVEGAFSKDFLYVNDAGSEIVLKAYSMPDQINTLKLREGRMPEAADECVLDYYQFRDKDMIGKQIVIADSNSDDSKNVFKYHSYKVVGMVNSPLYINIERGTTMLGNGRIGAFVFMPEAGLQFENYNEVYITFRNSYDIYSDEYKAFIEEQREKIEALCKNICMEYGIPESALMVLDRSSNVGYMCYDNDTNIVDGIAKVFPIFFLLIAALVCSTTMTRMVDDERGQIGTFRALGYSNGAIMKKYLIYSGSSALVGCFVGFFVGTWVFPYAISQAYRMLYDFGAKLEYYFSPGLLVICIVVSLLCSMGTTYLACKNELRCMPAELVRPKAPAAGKRIFLEHIHFLWSHMKFLHKITARNVFRFKKRMLMMIIGIAGCTALVLTGLGIKDSVSNLPDFQYGEIDIHDIEVTFATDVTEQTIEEIENIVGDSLQGVCAIYRTAMEYHTENAIKNVNVIVANEQDLNGFIQFNLIGDGKYPSTGETFISEKLAQIAKLSVGDEITFTDGESKSMTLTISGVFKNYVWHYAYVTPETFQRFFGTDCTPNTVYLNVTDDSAAFEAGANLKKITGAMNVLIVPEMKERVDNMMSMLDAVVGLVIASAAALAFIVLFNLSNINITERVREIATIKVLGFYPHETGTYVFRENLVLSLMGIIIGLPLGIWLHKYVIAQINVDMVSFAVKIKPASYVICCAIVLLFLVFVDLVMRRKIDTINMAESLKSVE